jgi:hypothetical protein
MPEPGNGHVARTPVAPPEIAGAPGVLEVELPAKRVFGRPFQKGHTLSTGRRKGSLNNRTKEVREFAQRVLEDAQYQRSLKVRLRNGTAPHIEQLLYHYAYGKPADRIKVQGLVGAFDLVTVLQEAAKARVGVGNGQVALPGARE